jgi:hypothetical protein
MTRRSRHADAQPDVLDEMIGEFTAANADFPPLLAAVERRRTLLRTLAELRGARELSQTRVAATMGTSQPTLARLETTASDAKLSTVERFATALGFSVEYHLVPAERSRRGKGVVVEDG